MRDIGWNTVTGVCKMVAGVRGGWSGRWLMAADAVRCTANGGGCISKECFTEPSM